MIGKNDFDMPWGRQAEGYRADDTRIIEARLPRMNYEEQLEDEGGDTIWQRKTKIPLLDANGTIYGILGTYEDITAPNDNFQRRERVKEA